MNPTPRHGASRAALSVLGAAALTLGGLAVAAPANAAQHEVIPASGSLDWGYKASFRTYVTGGMNPLKGNGIQVEDGASRSGTGIADGFRFPVSSGTAVDQNTLSISTKGTALFKFPAHFFEVRLSDLKVVVDAGVTSIVADTYLKADTAFGDIEPGTYEGNDVRIATASTSEVSIADGTVTVSGTKVTLTAEGAAANPLYAAGTELDDFSLSAQIEETPVTPAPERIDVTVPEATTEPEPETGTFGWKWANTTPVSLGTAVERAGSFTAEGKLNDIVVTDTRKGGSGLYSWSLTGVASDFASGKASFSSSHLGWTPTASGAGVTAGPVQQGLNAPALLASSGSAASATVSAALSLKLPTSTPAGDYTSMVTITAVG